MWDVAIFGAKSVALGVYHAIHELYPGCPIKHFVVSSMKENAPTLAGLPVLELGELERKDICILVATPENSHAEIVASLEEKGFHNHICIDSWKEADLMEKYYAKLGIFPSVRGII